MTQFPPEVSPNFAQLHSTMQTLEEACSLVQINVNPAPAEEAIAAFRRCPRPYQYCKYILENSQMANARFQAAGAIRDAAIREWALLIDEDKKNLIVFCLHYVMEHSSATDAYVQAKVSSVAAQLLKRGWMEFSAAEKEKFLTEVNHSILGLHGPEAQFSAINFLESLVSEFSLLTSSPMNLPPEFHRQCQSILEDHYLKRFYCWAKDAALMVTDNILKHDLSVLENKVCSAALRLMFQILNWDFKPKNHFSRGVNHENLFLKKFERTILQLGQEWNEVLISSGHITWILGLYGTLRKRFLHDVLWFDSPLAVSSRQLIVQLCSLGGSIFSSDKCQSVEKHLLQILSTVVEWIDPPDAVLAAINVGKSESEFLDGCHVLLSMATLTNIVTFDSILSKALRPFGTLHLLASLTCEMANFLAGPNNEEGIWCSEAMDILLETWNVLLGHIDFGNEGLSPDVKSVCARLFNSLLDSQLKAGSASAFDDDCHTDHFVASISTRDDRLSSYACIARATADTTLPLLATNFSQRVSILLQGKGQEDVTCMMEELYWLILIIGHVLTDSGEGETVLVPDALHIQFRHIIDAHQHPVVALSWSVINFAEWSLNPETRIVLFSPRLMEAIIWFLARWVDTYLMALDVEKHQLRPDSGNSLEHPSFSKKLLLSFAGENYQGKHLIDIFVRISATALISYPGETELQALTCHQLLPALVRRRNVCIHVVSLDSWRNLASAFANEKTLFSLTSRLQRSLSETFVRSASSIKDPNLTDKYVWDLLGSVANYLVESIKNEVKNVLQQPDVIIMIICLLERLRGAARATEPRTQKAIFHISLTVMDPLLVLMDIYKDEAAVVHMILKFAVSLVEGQVIFLNPGETAILVGFCTRLLQFYTSHNLRKISLSLSSRLGNALKTEKYKDLCALLQLLTSLCSKDLVDLSSASNGNEDMDIAQVVYTGLHTVIPLMSLELLKYPKLCYKYFSLLSHMLEVYPEKVSQLNDEAFKHIIATVDWGIHHQEIEVIEMCLRAVNSLASYKFKDNKGLGMKIKQNGSSDGISDEGPLSHFLRTLMHLLLFDDFSMELLGAAADALLPLLLCEQLLYQRLVHELIERQPNDELKSRLTSSFSDLMGSNQISCSLDRPNRQRFRKNFHKFFVDVSGFLRAR